MKKSMIPLFIILIICSLQLSAQSKSDIAMALYLKAEDAYKAADYESAFTNLRQAEQTLGVTNTKLLYLKILTLDMLSKTDAKYLADIQQSLAVFFNMVDKNTYPANKYSEILLIDLNIKQRAKEEEDDYNKLKNSGNISNYDEFFSKYPNSRYKDALSSKYKELQAKQRVDMETKFKEQWKSENLPEYRKQRGKAIGLLTSGLASFVVGGGLFGYYSINGFFYGDNIEDGNYGKGFFLGLTGSILTVYGIIAAPLSSKHFKAAKRIKNDARNNNIELSFLQQGNSVGLALTF